MVQLCFQLSYWSTFLPTEAVENGVKPHMQVNNGPIYLLSWKWRHINILTRLKYARVALIYQECEHNVKRVFFAWTLHRGEVWMFLYQFLFLHCSVVSLWSKCLHCQASVEQHNKVGSKAWAQRTHSRNRNPELILCTLALSPLIANTTHPYMYLSQSQ